MASTSTSPRVVIVGGGIIGLYSAYYLTRKGHQVTIIERTDGSDGCSFGNAGMIVPSHFIPLAVPGMIEKGIRWMFNSESPFYVKPRLNWDLIAWGLRFYRAANQKQVEKAMPALRDISLLSKKLYQDFSTAEGNDFSFEEKGLMMLCKTAHSFEEEAEVAETANRLGIEARVLDLQALHALEPEVKPDVAGAVYYPGDAHLYPNRLVQKLKNLLQERGVEFLYNTDVSGFRIESGRIAEVQTPVDSIAVDELIIAAGSWSPLLAKELGINLPMQAGKGYSTTLAQPQGKRLNIPSILLEARVAITPMGDDRIRFGGTMEIGGINQDINMNRVRGIIKAVPEFFPEYPIQVPDKSKVWSGLRPCSPDGLPYIGRVNKYQNLIVASGHAMMGLSLAPGTGKLVQEIVDEDKTSIDIKLYKPERYN